MPPSSEQFFCPEDVSGASLRNDGSHLPTYAMPQIKQSLIWILQRELQISHLKKKSILCSVKQIMWGFMVDRVALRQVLLPVLRSTSVSIIPPIFHAHSFFYHRRSEIVTWERIVK